MLSLKKILFQLELILKGFVFDFFNISSLSFFLTIISFRGIPINGNGSNIIFDLEDKINEICKTFSIKNYNQEQNLIEALKINCRKTVKEKTGKRP